MNKPIDAAVLEKAVALLKELNLAERQQVLANMYPDKTKIVGEITFFARDLYRKHLEFFEAGARYKERCAMAANRVGKTLGMGGYETAVHVSGLYPDWWKGKRFDGAVDWWAAGKTNETTRDIVQRTLFGKVVGEKHNKRFDGTGLIPAKAIGKITWRSGVANLADTVEVNHQTGGKSLLGLKSYEQGRGSFEGTAKHGVWFDEEPPLDVYSEAIIRTATTDGIGMITFTPLEGISETVLQFMPGSMRPQES